MLATSFIQEFSDVGEILDVTTLVGRQCNSVGILLDGAIDHGLCRLVVAQMNHFSSGGLNQPAHDVDSSIVTIEQRCSRNHTDWTCCGLKHRFLVGHVTSTHLWFINSRVKQEPFKLLKLHLQPMEEAPSWPECNLYSCRSIR